MCFLASADQRPSPVLCALKSIWKKNKKKSISYFTCKVVCLTLDTKKFATGRILYCTVPYCAVLVKLLSCLQYSTSTVSKPTTCVISYLFWRFLFRVYFQKRFLLNFQFFSSLNEMCQILRTYSPFFLVLSCIIIFFFTSLFSGS